MTPANDPNGKPFIYRIADALGITHLVVAVQHSHLISEITGLLEELADKADKQHHHDKIYLSVGTRTGIVRVKKNNETNDVNIDLAFEDLSEEEFERKVSITWSNLKNLERALLDPDSTPTTNSDKLVTSGGVKAALDGKQDALTFDTTPTADSTNPVTSGGVKAALDQKMDEMTIDTTPTSNSNNLVKSGGVKAAIDDATKAVFGSMPYYITAAHEKMYVHTRILRNNTGATIKLTECIDVSALPAAERANVYWNAPDIDLPNNTEIGIRFVRASNAVFLYYDGNFDY